VIVNVLNGTILDETVTGNEKDEERQTVTKG
jgi:hypothetical protein